MFRTRRTLYTSLLLLSILAVRLTAAEEKQVESQICASLRECAEVGDTRKLDELIRRGEVLELADKYGETPLFRAVRFRKIAAISLLLAAGANINTSNQDGTTPLMMAVLDQDYSLIKQLVVAGADVNASDNDGDSVLIHGAVFGVKQTTPILRFLVSRGANVNAAAKDGRTALIFSISSLAVENVKCLLTLGASVGAKDKKGMTAYGYTNELPIYNDAARSIQKQMRMALTRAGAST